MEYLLELSYESWISIYLLEIMQIVSTNIFHNKGRICGSIRSDKENYVARENTLIFAREIGELHSSISRQYFCNQVGQESQAS